MLEINRRLFAFKIYIAGKNVVYHMLAFPIVKFESRKVAQKSLKRENVAQGCRAQSRHASLSSNNIIFTI